MAKKESAASGTVDQQEMGDQQSGVEKDLVIVTREIDDKKVQYSKALGGAVLQTNPEELRKLNKEQQAFAEPADEKQEASQAQGSQTAPGLPVPAAI